VDTASRDELYAELDRVIAAREKLLNEAKAVEQGLDLLTGQHLADYQEALDKATKQVDILHEKVKEMLKGPSVFGAAPALPEPNTKQAQAAFEEALKNAKLALAELKKDSDEATKYFLEQVKLRLEATGAEGRSKLELFDQFSREEMQMLVTNGKLREKFETDLANRIETQRDAINASVHDAKVKARLLREVAAA